MSSMTGFRGPSGSSAPKVPSGYRAGQTQNYTPEQMQLFQSLFSNVQPGSYLSKLSGGDQDTFNQIEAPALRQFGQLQGQTASRFSQLAPGSMSARRSSGFNNAINQQTSDFAQDLQSRRQGLQRQALLDLMGISDSLLGQRPYENFLVPKKKSFLQELGLGLSGGAGQALGFLPSLFLGG